MEFSAEMIAAFLDGEIVGNKDATVNTMAKIEEGTSGALSFLSNMKYEAHIYTTDATIVIVNKTFEPSEPIKATIIKVEDAYSCFAKLLELYAANKPQKVGVSPKAAISETAQLGEDCYVGEFAVIADNVKIGNNTKIYPQVYVGDDVVIGNNVTLGSGVKIYEGCIIGSDVVLHANVVIGADGFGFAPNEKGEFIKIPQIGNVVIEDNVEIGANTCVDRATMGSTTIKRGVKLDNQIQIGHNVVVGENTVCAAQVGISGSTKVGANCVLGGQVGVAGHLVLGDKVQIGSKSGISNNIAAGEIHMGYPSMPIRKFQRVNAVYRNLLGINSDVNQMKKDIAKLKE